MIMAADPSPPAANRMWATNHVFVFKSPLFEGEEIAGDNLRSVRWPWAEEELGSYRRRAKARLSRCTQTRNDARLFSIICPGFSGTVIGTEIPDWSPLLHRKPGQTSPELRAGF